MTARETSAYPRNHPLRFELSEEVHARPPEALSAPLRVSFLALAAPAALREQELLHVSNLAERFGAPPPRRGVSHYSVDLGAFRLKWERHAEFSDYTFIAADDGSDWFETPAAQAVPAEWLKAIPGEILVAINAVLAAGTAVPPDYEDLARRFFAGNTLIGATVADGRAIALTDVRIHDGGFGRLVILDQGMTTPRQAGRTMQRLLEIETYRLMALLALPVARRLAPALSAWEHELAGITAKLAGAASDDELALLDSLTKLEAEIDSREADDHFRFSAAEAYYDLVLQRIEDLREGRIEGLQTYNEFTCRRLTPAMKTCASVAGRLRSLSERVSRATQLLSTRVDIARQTQNQAVLASMDRRAALQLRLGETVEGLSVAAVTYYIVALVGHAAEALEAAGLEIKPSLAMGISIPFVILFTALGIRSIRRHVTLANKKISGGEKSEA
ncbi:MAG: DUF3422 domain-containing protein [Beijerinckiaceae bacterium]|jgi:uncharacterized membrane-anchored protein